MDEFENIKNKNNFSVPKDYFDYLPVEIMDKIHMESKQKTYFYFFKPSITIPSLAVLSAVIIFLVFFFNKDIPSNELVLSETEVRQIINNHELYNIDETSITEQYLSLNISNDNEMNISDEEIKSYLEENTDVTNIINEL